MIKKYYQAPIHSFLIEFTSFLSLFSFIKLYFAEWQNPISDLIKNKKTFYNDEDFEQEMEIIRKLIEDKIISNAVPLVILNQRPILWIKCSYFQISELIKGLSTKIKKIYLDYKFYLCGDFGQNPHDNMFSLAQIRESFFNYSGKGVKIALLDTGIDITNGDLEASVYDRLNLIGEKNLDNNGHGTILAGIITGNGAQSKGEIVGVAPNSKILDIKCFSEEGISSLGYILIALELIFARKKEDIPDIILFGGTSSIIEEKNGLLQNYCERLINEFDCYIVSPIGNFGPDPNWLPTPANISNIITVGSLSENNKIAFFSSPFIKIERKNYNNGKELEDVNQNINYYNINQVNDKKENDIDIINNKKLKKVKVDINSVPTFYAPGSNILSTFSSKSKIGKYLISNPSYGILSGTSTSAAIIVGILAIILEAFPRVKKNVLLKKIPVKKLSSSIRIPDLEKMLHDSNKLFPKPLSFKELYWDHLSSILLVLTAIVAFLLYVIKYLR